jgi:hypothetical protein
LFSLFFSLYIDDFLYSQFLQDHQFMASHPPLPEEGPINAEVAPADSEAPEAGANLDGDGPKGSLEESDSTLSPPAAETISQGSEKK